MSGWEICVALEIKSIHHSDILGFKMAIEKISENGIYFHFPLIFFANGVLNNYLFLTIRYVLNKKKVALLRAADWKNHSLQCYSRQRAC